jgi:glutaredoxin
MIKLFFKGLRLVLMPFMLLWAKFGTPKGMVRPDDEQIGIDLECSNLALYHFRTCPFCIKVRHEMARLTLPIPLRDAQYDIEHRDTLLQGGGKIQTPCLCISDGKGDVQWLYESKAIMGYLRARFGG